MCGYPQFSVWITQSLLRTAFPHIHKLRKNTSALGGTVLYVSTSYNQLTATRKGGCFICIAAQFSLIEDWKREKCVSSWKRGVSGGIREFPIRFRNFEILLISNRNFGFFVVSTPARFSMSVSRKIMFFVS